MNNNVKWLAVEIEDWSEREYMLVANNITEWNEWEHGMRNGKMTLVILAFNDFTRLKRKTWNVQSYSYSFIL